MFIEEERDTIEVMEEAFVYFNLANNQPPKLINYSDLTEAERSKMEQWVTKFRNLMQEFPLLQNK